MKLNGLRRLAWAVLSAALDGLTERLLRAGNAFIASGRATPAKAVLRLADALIWASEWADALAFPKARV